MAGNDKTKARATAADPVAPAGDHPSAHPTDAAPVDPEHRAPTSHSEWTVSDRRGPLHAATVEDGVERMVPGSEMDAEGSGDTAVAGEVVHPTEVHATEAHAAEVHAAEVHAADPITDPIADPVIDTAHGSTVDPAPEPTPTMATAASAPPRRSLMPVAAGIVLGAILGAGSAALVYMQSSSNSGTTSGQLAQLTARVDALDKRPDPAAAIAGLKSQVADLGAQVAALQKKGAAPGQASPQAQGDAGPLAAKVASLQASVDALKQNGSPDLAAKLATLQGQQQGLDGKVGALQAAVAGTQKQASAAQSGIDTLQGQQKVLEGKLGAPALAVVSDSLVAQIQAGKPFATQVDALASLGADPAKVAVLRQNAAQGVPWAKTLLAKFKPLAEPIVATGTKAPANAGFLARLQHGLFALVSVRRADETTGTDVASRVALIEADLAHDDVTGAYAAWSALPADAKTKSDAWGALAKTSVEAINAARDLQSSAIGALGAKRS